MDFNETIFDFQGLLELKIVQQKSKMDYLVGLFYCLYTYFKTQIIISHVRVGFQVQV